MITYDEILDSLRGKGRQRRPSNEFWELRKRWDKTLSRSGLCVYKDNGHWWVDISNLSRESLQTALAEILPHDDLDVTRGSVPPRQGRPPKYYKLNDGRWGVCGTGSPPRLKSWIIVQRRDGKMRREKLHKFLNAPSFFERMPNGRIIDPDFDWICEIVGQERPPFPVCQLCGREAAPYSACIEREGYNGPTTHWPKVEASGKKEFPADE